MSSALVTRRALLGAAGGALLLGTRTARATIMCGLTLTALAQRSDHIVVGRALDSRASFVTVGGSRRIVTDVRVLISEVIAKAATNPEVVVRVLGGRVGHDAELVDGQAELTAGAPCVLFLRAETPDLQWVNGMAQGHFPLRDSGNGLELLTRSPRLPELLGAADSAVARLAGQELGAARALVRGALAP